MKRPALFLDRDGIVNEEIGYLHNFEHVRWISGIVPLIQRANQFGYFVAVVTNQAGIGRGYYTEEQFQELMRHMCAALASQGATVDAVYHSPFHPEHGVGIYRRESDCRKPGPGMLLRAAAEHDLDLASSMMVGDRCSDMLAGAAAGLTQLFLLMGTETTPCTGVVYEEISSLDELLDRFRPSPVSTI